MIVKWRLLLPVLFLGPVGCGGGEAALSVDSVDFERTELLGLSEGSIRDLVTLTSVGIAFARGEEANLARPFIASEWEELRISRLREETALERAGIDDATLEARYRSDPEPELVVRHLVVLSERWRPAEHREAARTRAFEALALIQGGRPFPEVAGEFSEEPGARERGGLLTPGREGSWVPEFWNAASSLAPGETSGVVESEFGFHVLHLEERRAIPFVEARDRFAARIAAGIEETSAWQAQVDGWSVAAGALGEGESADDFRRRVLLTEADRREITLPPLDSTRVEEAWVRRLQGWAGALGFTAGMTAAEIADQAPRALGRTDQEARVARDALAAHADALSEFYSVRHATP